MNLVSNYASLEHALACIKIAPGLKLLEQRDRAALFEGSASLGLAGTSDELGAGEGDFASLVVKLLQRTVLELGEECWDAAEFYLGSSASREAIVLYRRGNECVVRAIVDARVLERLVSRFKALAPRDFEAEHRVYSMMLPMPCGPARVTARFSPRSDSSLGCRLLRVEVETLNGLQRFRGMTELDALRSAVSPRHGGGVLLVASESRCAVDELVQFIAEGDEYILATVHDRSTSWFSRPGATTRKTEFFDCGEHGFVRPGDIVLVGDVDSEAGLREVCGMAGRGALVVVWTRGSSPALALLRWMELGGHRSLPAAVLRGAIVIDASRERAYRPEPDVETFIRLRTSVKGLLMNARSSSALLDSRIGVSELSAQCDAMDIHLVSPEVVWGAHAR